MSYAHQLRITYANHRVTENTEHARSVLWTDPRDFSVRPLCPQWLYGWRKWTSLSAGLGRVHVERLDEERKDICALLDDLAGRLAGPVTGLGLDADQHRRWTSLRGLDRRGKLEAV